MLKGIIFDMDGVLINSEPFHFKVWKETLKRRGVDLDYSVYKNSIGSTDGFLMQLLYENYGIDPWDTSLMTEMEALKEETDGKRGISPPYSLCGRAFRETFKGRISDGGCFFFPSGIYRENHTSLLGNPRNTLNKLVSGESVAHPKPAPDVFLKAAGELGLSPRNTRSSVIEDSENGCKAAKSAGITCIGYYNPDSGDQDLEHAI